MKKIFTLVLISSFIFCNDALSLNTAARTAIIASHASSIAKQPRTTSGIDKLIGKEIQGCKIVSAFYDGYRGVIYGLCIKDNYFYDFRTWTRTLTYDCKGFNCESDSIGKDLIKLLEEKQND